jgi:hypothetical protein
MIGREASGTQELSRRGVLSTMLADDRLHAADLLTADRECLDACNGVRELCGRTSSHCLRQALKGRSEYVEALRVSTDCREFCALTSSLITRRSTLMGAASEACAHACEACAAACEQVELDELLLECARQCRYCARMCRELAHLAGAH